MASDFSILHINLWSGSENGVERATEHQLRLKVRLGTFLQQSS